MMNTTKQLEEPLRTIRMLSGGGYHAESFDYSTLNALRGIQMPTVFIGLGGTGTLAVSELKELFVRVFQGKGGAGAGSIPDGYRFLCFDSAVDDKPANLRKGEEWIQLTGEGMQHGTWDSFHAMDTYKPWLIKGVSYSEFQTGCQGFRNLGRFLFNLNIGEISGAVRKAVTLAKNQPQLDRPGDVNIYIFCTLAGGTGAGCFLDLAFLLRDMFSDRTHTKVRAFLSCPPGFSQRNENLRHRAHAGVYAALRELDHFMNPDRRERWLDKLEKEPPHGYLGKQAGAERGKFLFPGGSAHGVYAEPFDHCFLIGSQGGADAKVLSNPSDFARFMARCVFAMTAYPVPDTAQGGGSQTFASQVNNANQQLHQVLAGVRTGYIVPGISSVHAPLAEALGALQIRASLVLLRDMLHGNANSEDRNEAQSFLATENAGTDALRRFFEAKLSDILVFPRAVIEENAELLRKRKGYERRDDILGIFARVYGGDAPEERAKRHSNQVWDEELKSEDIRFNDAGERLTPLTINEWTARFRRQVEIECSRFLATQGMRRIMVEDFLNDLLILLKEQLWTARQQENQLLQAYERSCRDWQDGASNRDSFRHRLEDVTSKDGMVDAFGDMMMVGSVAADFVAEAENAHRQEFNYVIASMLRRQLDAVVELVEDWQGSCERYFHACRRVEVTIELNRKRLLDILKQEADGKGTDIDRVFSFNIMHEEWREEFAKRYNLQDVGALQAIILAEELRKREELKKLKRDEEEAVWRPLDVVAVADDKTRNTSGYQLEEIIEMDVIATLSPLFSEEYKRLSHWSDGRGMRDIIEFLQKDNQQAGHRYGIIGKLLADKASPQWDISMNATRIPGNNTCSMSMLGAPQNVGENLVKYAEQEGEVSVSLSYEASRITMLTLAYPVALTGCPEVHAPFKSLHDLHLRALAQAGEAPDSLRRKFYCYPESWLWDEPVFSEDASTDWGRKMGVLFAIGMLPAEAAITGAAKAAIDSYLAQTPAGGPKVGTLGLAIRGKAEAWLFAFAEIDLAAGASACPEVPELLARGLHAAQQILVENDHFQESANAWLDWLEKSRSALFSDKEWQEFAASVKKELADIETRVEAGSPDHRVAMLMLNGWERYR